MFDKNQLIEMKWSNANKSWFTSKGYTFTKNSDVFFVKAKDLQKTSKKAVKVICDYCNRDYKTTMATINKKSGNKDCCSHCMPSKQAETTLKNRAKYQFDKVRAMCEKNDYELLTDESEFTDIYMDISYTCKKHGKQTSMLNNFVRGHKCICCSYEERGQNLRHSIEHIKSVIENYNGNKLLNPGDYVGSKESNLNIRCSCGNVFTTSFDTYIHSDVKKCFPCSCKESIGEKRIRELLENKQIEFVQEKYFDDCRDIKPLPFDFYLSKYNLIIEFDGKQHFEEVGFGNYEITKLHDGIKNEYCKTHNIDLLRIPYWEGNNIENIILDKLNL